MKNSTTEPAEQLVQALASMEIKNPNRLNKLKRQYANDNRLGIPTNAELLVAYRALLLKKQIAPNQELEQLLKKRKIRTLSGVAPIAVLTKPHPCPGQCVFCPTEAAMPKSYLSNEPAVMRAERSQFDPFKQVTARLRALENNGHDTDKVELIIMGGTWSCHETDYQDWFVKRCFDGCNGKTSTKLAAAQKLNETAKHRIVAMTLETRPDYVDESEVVRMRALGATKVELGVQAIDDKILHLNKRGHGVAAIVNATKLLKQSGFKICYHIMPGLPGSTARRDLAMYKKLFSRAEFQPDFIKIYPTVVTKNSELYKWWRAGEYIPYSEKALFDLLLKMKLATPAYVRIIRLIRDIPEESIEAGNHITNLREALQAELIRKNKKCRCLRCREVKDDLSGLEKAKLFITKYKASNGTEYFLELADKKSGKLFAFLRLRLPNKKEANFISDLTGSAMIREIHTYGQMAPLVFKQTTGAQHQGLGARLMMEAEAIAIKQGFTKLAVISGIGVRGYYRKLGYELQGTYMVKSLKKLAAHGK